jgi:1,4-dihydroxy-2-naphthoate octaprenyltransferase
LYSYTQNSAKMADPTLFFICLPLILVHWAMLIAFQIPDIAADRQVGKNTLSVRLGARLAFQLHHLLLGLAALAALWLALLGQPAARFAWLVLPLALWQILTTSAYLQKTHPAYLWLTMRALAIFAVGAFLWLVGMAVG